MENPRSDKIDFAPDVDFSRILTNPILDIGAHLWEEERYKAFKVFYRSMRKIDDLVDHKKTSLKVISREEALFLERMMTGWLNAVRMRDYSDPFVEEFCYYLERFKIPLWPWESLVEAMVYDLKHRGFKNFTSFLRYTRGAAVAPASIFMHLCGVRVTREGYLEPLYDIRKTARPLAIFSYLVHIIRDFQKDQLNDLQYFSDDLLARNSLTPLKLKEIAATGQIKESFRNLIQTYMQIAEYYRKKARHVIDRAATMLLPRYRLSLEMIYHLYLQIYDKIDPQNSSFSQEELQPQPEDVNRQIQTVIKKFSSKN